MFYRWVLVFACGCSLFLLQSSPASASLQVGNTIRFYDREGSPGGEFGLALAGTPNKPELFRTFCLERSEYLDFNAAGFKIVGITDKAVNGGVTPGGDPLSLTTKVLYSWFRNKTLAGYDYTPNSATHVTSANELQEAFWALEAEGVTANGQAATWIASAANWIATTSTKAQRDFVDSHVKVLNLVWATGRSGYAAGSVAQDQLYYVPEPISLTVWAGVGGVFCLFSRRRRQASR